MISQCAKCISLLDNESGIVLLLHNTASTLVSKEDSGWFVNSDASLSSLNSDDEDIY